MEYSIGDIKLEKINMSAGGSNVLMSLKNKMQNLRDELEKYKDMYDEKCQELDEEKAKSQEVSSLGFSFLPVFCPPWSVRRYSTKHCYSQSTVIVDDALNAGCLVSIFRCILHKWAWTRCVINKWLTASRMVPQPERPTTPGCRPTTPGTNHFCLVYVGE